MHEIEIRRALVRTCPGCPTLSDDGGHQRTNADWSGQAAAPQHWRQTQATPTNTIRVELRVSTKDFDTPLRNQKPNSVPKQKHNVDDFSNAMH